MNMSISLIMMYMLSYHVNLMLIGATLFCALVYLIRSIITNICGRQIQWKQWVYWWIVLTFVCMGIAGINLMQQEIYWPVLFQLTAVISLICGTLYGIDKLIKSKAAYKTKPNMKAFWKSLIIFVILLIGICIAGMIWNDGYTGKGIRPFCLEQVCMLKKGIFIYIKSIIFIVIAALIAIWYSKPRANK